MEKINNYQQIYQNLFESDDSISEIILSEKDSENEEDIIVDAINSFKMTLIVPAQPKIRSFSFINKSQKIQNIVLQTQKVKGFNFVNKKLKVSQILDQSNQLESIFSSCDSIQTQISKFPRESNYKKIKSFDFIRKKSIPSGNTTNI